MSVPRQSEGGGGISPRNHKQKYSNYRPQRSCGKVMFSRESVILFMGGRVCLGDVADIPWADTPPRQTPPCPVHVGMHTSPAQCMLGYMPPSPSGSHSSRLYASYWNAFLFFMSFQEFIADSFILILSLNCHW